MSCKQFCKSTLPLDHIHLKWTNLLPDNSSLNLTSFCCTSMHCLAKLFKYRILTYMLIHQPSMIQSTSCLHLKELSCSNILLVPTKMDGGTLALLLSRPDENLVECWLVGPRLGSDHYVVFCQLNVPKSEVQKEVISSRNIRNIDLQAFSNDFQVSLNSEDIDSENVNFVINDFEKSVTVTPDKHAPVTKKTCSNRVRQPWYNHEIHEARRGRKSEKKWRKTGLKIHHQLYLDQPDLYYTMIENAKKVYVKNKLKDADS